MSGSRALRCANEKVSREHCCARHGRREHENMPPGRDGATPHIRKVNRASLGGEIARVLRGEVDAARFGHDFAALGLGLRKRITVRRPVTHVPLDVLETTSQPFAIRRAAWRSRWTVLVR